MWKCGLTNSVMFRRLVIVLSINMTLMIETAARLLVVELVVIRREGTKEKTYKSPWR